MIAQLDPENAQAFEKMSQLAKDHLADMYRHEGAEELKSKVRDALEKEDMEIEFEQKGPLKVKRKHEPNRPDKAETSELNEAWICLIMTNKV